MGDNEQMAKEGNCGVLSKVVKLAEQVYEGLRIKEVCEDVAELKDGNLL